jgi:hypothetical protein
MWDALLGPSRRGEISDVYAEQEPWIETVV